MDFAGKSGELSPSGSRQTATVVSTQISGNSSSCIGDLPDAQGKSGPHGEAELKAAQKQSIPTGGGRLSTAMIEEHRPPAGAASE